MATAKLRVGGAWVDTTLAGSVRVAGAWVPFGPGGGGPVVESIAWSQAPAFTDLNDGGQAYNMGIRYSIAEPRRCHGVEWRVPDTVTTPPGGAHVASLWRQSDQSRVRYTAFTPTPGVTQRIWFETPPTDPDPGAPWPTDPLDDSEFWVVAIYTIHYVFRTGAELLPATTPSGNVVADEGRLVAFSNDSLVYPDQAFNAVYYISPLMEV